jgi:hypothetical protein
MPETALMVPSNLSHNVSAALVTPEPSNNANRTYGTEHAISGNKSLPRA